MHIRVFLIDSATFLDDLGDLAFASSHGLVVRNDGPVAWDDTLGSFECGPLGVQIFWQDVESFAWRGRVEVLPEFVDGCLWILLLGGRFLLESVGAGRILSAEYNSLCSQNEDRIRKESW
jgi:hypothetical protein